MKIQISAAALVLRMKRKLAKDGKTLKSNKPGTRQIAALGRYCIVDRRRNEVVESSGGRGHVGDIERRGALWLAAKAKTLGLLGEWEEVV